MAQSAGDQFPPTGQFVEVDETRLHYRVEGDDTDPAVLLLHGASANLLDMHLALNDELDSMRAIYLDRPGLGWSDRPDGRWNPEREANLIASFMETMGVDSAIIVGHSWGGAISLRLALDHPDRVEGLVLVAPAARAWVGEAASYNRLTHWPILGTLMTRVIVPTYGRGQLESGARSAFSPDPMPEGYVEDTALPLIVRASSWKANAWDMSQVNHSLAEQEVRYDEITAPTVIIAGTEDTVLLTPRHSGAIAETIPNAELILIDGAGHNPHHQQSSVVISAINRIAGDTDQVFNRAAIDCGNP